MQKEFLKKDLSKIVENSLLEDRALDDVTSDLIISENESIKFEINSREEMVFCGKEVILEVFSQLRMSDKFKDSELKLDILTKDGLKIKKSKSIASGIGNARLVFAAERVLLNLIQHLSGIATITNKFTELLNNKKIKILDTRKTISGLRSLQKYAVMVGGGRNHRFNLSDMILIKDNHIAAAGSITKAITCAKRNKNKLKIEVECDNLEQVSETMISKPHVVMLDNMKVSDIRKAIKIINKKSQIEISGGVNISNIKNFSNLEIDFISIGLLTHSVRAVDIGLDIIS